MMNIIENKFFCYVLATFLSFSSAQCMEEEYKIPTRIMDNGVRWEDDVSNQANSSTCCSHAVVECLKYVHERHRILPFYLHKYAHYHLGTKNESGEFAYQDYNTGHHISNLMRFSRDYGVPEIPLGQTFQQGSGLSFPHSKKYGFVSVYNVFDDETGRTKVEKIKHALRSHNLPLVFAVMSSRGNERLFTDRTHPVPLRLRGGGGDHVGSSTDVRTYYHAITAYGYSDIERGILIKNSWGTSYCSQGKALLDYDYLENYWTEGAYIGIGISHIDQDYPYTTPGFGGLLNAFSEVVSPRSLLNGMSVPIIPSPFSNILNNASPEIVNPQNALQNILTSSITNTPHSEQCAIQ